MPRDVTIHYPSCEAMSHRASQNFRCCKKVRSKTSLPPPPDPHLTNSGGRKGRMKRGCVNRDLKPAEDCQMDAKWQPRGAKMEQHSSQKKLEGIKKEQTLMQNRARKEAESEPYGFRRVIKCMPRFVSTPMLILHSIFASFVSHIVPLGFQNV